MALSHIVAAAAGAGAAVVASRLRAAEPVRLARRAGSTVAAPGAAVWVTDFLNAAYYAKPAATRHLDDLRLAFAIQTTYWHRQGGRRLGARDVRRFHDAFGSARLQGSGGRRGTLDTRALLAGAERLFGPWFRAAVADPDCCGWGIVFPDAAAKAAHDPELRLRQAAVGQLTPPTRPDEEQVWHTYPPVELPDAQRAVEALLAVEHWPDYASELGRFTPLRRGGLEGQTFEIEVVGFPSPRTPVFTRAYVSVDELVTAADPAARDAWVQRLRRGFDRRADQPSPVPDAARVLAGLDLVSHEGHFMGNATNRLLVYEVDGRGYVRAAGAWDPMPWHLAELYEQVGRWSQHAFWGMGSPEQSMLHQLALATERSTTAGARHPTVGPEHRNPPSSERQR